MYPAQKHVENTFNHLDKTKPHILLLAGEKTGYRNDTDRELVFRQESNFFYLTGCDIPSSLFIAAHDPATSAITTHLFIPNAVPADILWSVPPPPLDIAAQTHNVTHLHHPAALSDTLRTLIQALPGAVVHVLPRNSPLFPSLGTEYTDLVPGAVLTDTHLLPALQRARLIKDDYEIALIRKANEISSRAHETVMRVLGMAVKAQITRGKGAGADRPLLPGEWLIEKEAEAEAIFVASCRREGAVHQAYLPIVAASTRASTLHYCCNDKEFAWGPVDPNQPSDSCSFAGHAHAIHPQVLLIDAGCEYSNYASDITRTMPVGNNGRFTAESKEIYNLVLSMQHAAFNLLKPGVHWDDVHFMCHRVLVRRFLELGIFKGGNEEAILASGVSAAFFPHGLGHSLGLDVHDVPEASKPVVNETIPKRGGADHESFYTYLRLRLPLRDGMVVTVEPGVYFSPHLIAPVRASEYINQEVLQRYESVGGVRIEDVVVIRENGYENLTGVKSETAWIEGVCSGEL